MVAHAALELTAVAASVKVQDARFTGVPGRPATSKGKMVVMAMTESILFNECADYR